MLKRLSILALLFTFMLPPNLSAQTKLTFADDRLEMTVPGNWQLENEDMTEGVNSLMNYKSSYHSPDRAGSLHLDFSANDGVISAKALKMLFGTRKVEGVEIIRSEILTINEQDWFFKVTKYTGDEMPLYRHEFKTDTEQGMFQVSFSLKTTEASNANDIVDLMKQTMTIESK